MTQSGDSPWKEIIEQLLEEFLQLLFPDLEDRIIWSNGHKFYDKELDKLWEDTGCASVVKLVKVQIQSKDHWLLLHFVTQVPANELVGGKHYYEAFEDGVFMNHLRVRAHYKQPVTSVVVLGVNNLAWRPLPYKEEEFDCWLHFGFPVRRLVDFAYNCAALERSRNPVAFAILAHLQAQETKNSPLQRKLGKWELWQLLQKKNYPRKQTELLSRFLARTLSLPAEYEAEFQQVVTHGANAKLRRELQQRKATEARKEQKDIEDFRELIEMELQIRFEDVPATLLEQVKHLSDVSQLHKLERRACKSPTLASFVKAFNNLSGTPSRRTSPMNTN